MNKLILFLLQTELGRRIELQLLINFVTSSLGLPKERVLMKSSEKALEIFTQLTVTHLSGCNKYQIELLNKKAFLMGRILRSCLINRSAEALMRVVVLLYRNIGIDMEGVFPDEVSILHCHFCRYYDSRTCIVASAIDSGVICGLYDVELLCFTQRITEGKEKCCCHLKKKI